MKTRARTIGAVYLAFFLTAIAGGLLTPGTGFGPGGVSNDAAGFARSVQSNEAMYQLGVAIGLLSTVLYLALIALFYQLFRPVSRTSSLLFAFFGLAGSIITAVGSVFQISPTVILHSSGGLDTAQLQSLALLFVHMNAAAGEVALVFFGSFQLFLGYVIYRSTFLPRLIGVLIAVAGVGWLTYAYPPVASVIAGPTGILGFAAEAALMLWLLIMGVNAERAAASVAGS